MHDGGNASGENVASRSSLFGPNYDKKDVGDFWCAVVVAEKVRRGRTRCKWVQRNSWNHVHRRCIFRLRHSTAVVVVVVVMVVSE